MNVKYSPSSRTASRTQSSARADNLRRICKRRRTGSCSDAVSVVITNSVEEASVKVPLIEVAMVLSISIMDFGVSGVTMFVVKKEKWV